MKTNTIKATQALIMLFATLIMAACAQKKGFTYSEAEATKQDIVTSVTATGTIEPVTSVDVGTQVSGIISKLYVDYNSEVKAGQVIAELDRTNLISELSSAQAMLKSAQSNLDYQKTNHERYKALYDKGLISANDYEQARLSYVQAQQQTQQQKENVKKAQTNLGYATITSPIDGVVLSKEVEEGQTVASSYNTPTLFKIARDLTDMRVIADVDEADIGDVREGQRVNFTVDAFPDDTFQGEVTQVRQQAATESNVVTYEVVISAPNQDLKLKPGLTANVTIYTLERNGVLAVPSRAIRFTPNEVLLQEDETVIDTDAPTKVWTKEGNTFKAHKVETGMSNGIYTEIISGIKPGTEVLTDFEIIGGQPQEDTEQASNPFMPRPRNNRKNNTNAPKK